LVPSRAAPVARHRTGPRCSPVDRLAARPPLGSAVELSCDRSHADALVRMVPEPAVPYRSVGIVRPQPGLTKASQPLHSLAAGRRSRDRYRSPRAISPTNTAAMRPSSSHGSASERSLSRRNGEKGDAGAKVAPGAKATPGQRRREPHRLSGQRATGGGIGTDLHDPGDTVTQSAPVDAT